MARQPTPSTSAATLPPRATSSSSSRRPQRSSSHRRHTRLGAAAATLALLGLSSALLPGAHALALNEPANGLRMFGAWVQTDEGDTPLAFNTRFGLNASVIQIAQDIPNTPYNWTTGAGGNAPEELIERTGTDAAVFLTVYPATGLAEVNETNLQDLGNQILNYTQNYNRSVFLRYAPEMNGNWNAYGLQPVAFKQHWIWMYGIVKTIASDVAIVWAPNTGQGYPYSMSLPTNTTEADALDTSGDGELTVADSPFSPYYPGDEYVDWVGLSVYYKGPNSENVNADQPAGYCADAMINYSPWSTGGAAADPWYQNYCANKTDIACMLSESGAAYHDEISGNQGVSELSLKQTWWQDCLTNTTFFNTFDRMKLFMQFEYEKNETDSGVEDHRDYRLTNKTDVLSAFQSDMATASSYYTWANYRTSTSTPANQVTSTNLVTTTNSLGQTVTSTSLVLTSTFSFATARITNTGFPSLFGNYESSALRAVAVSVALFATTCSAVLGGMMFMFRM